MGPQAAPNPGLLRSPEPGFSEAADDLLQRVGVRVRSLRRERGFSRKELGERAGLSERFLALVEGGQGNPSLRSLADIARALGTTPVALIEPPRGIVSLLGLRGAGKSTVGRALSKRLRAEFIELDARIEEAAGLSLAEIWELHGEAYYRRLEREVLAKILEGTPRAVLATGGGIVAEPATWAQLRRSTLTVWLRARPELHWDRVVAQGDHRPMANDPLAMERLRALLSERESQYEAAHYTVDTSDCDVAEVVRRVEAIVRAA
jgi:XRE family transcriptional regulator, aerobic/anaerobic benzoate catabolism transcriptional regulator